MLRKFKIVLVSLIFAQVHADCVLPLQVDCFRLSGQSCALGQEGPRGLRLQVEQEKVILSLVVKHSLQGKGNAGS